MQGRGRRTAAPKQNDNPNLSKRALSPDLQATILQFDSELGINVGFDVGRRSMELAGRSVAMYYINGFTKDLDMLQVMKSLNEYVEADAKKPGFDLERLVNEHLYYLQVSREKEIRKIYYHILSGRIALLFDGEDEAVLIEARQFPGRTPEEPDIERVVRGSRDGFTEALVTNTAMIRRRIRDPRLRFKLVKVGRRSQTDVAVAYIEDIAQPYLVEDMLKRIQEVDVDGLPMAEKSLEEFLTAGDWNPLPRVRYTERPDVSAMHLLEGHVLVLVDTSPSVMITPVTYFHHLQHAEEYRQNAPVGIYLRLVRYLAVLASIFVLPLWLMVSMRPELLPASLAFIGPKEAGSVPLFLQVLVAEFGLDMIRMAAIHTPSPLATALGLIAAFMIGEVAIKVGLFHPEIVLYIAVAAVGTFATPSYELGQANRLIRLFLLTMVAAFSWPGFLVGLVMVGTLIVSTKSFGYSYFWPVVPFSWSMLGGALWRGPVPAKRMRPSFLKPIDPDRLPEEFAGTSGGSARPAGAGVSQTTAEKPTAAVEKGRQRRGRRREQMDELPESTVRWRHSRRSLWEWVRSRWGRQ
ncbi:spore germination protein [Heliophilum fasciatum]|uniref:Stage V sporulation protein AF n=1 Tax=Heliophilum fasciatum TaxID=35700 RepID=A0A4R2RWR2_9FIRM|nr:spore germination protein [Heliophilum fasciatum]MCW2277371.1 stage V sporulation protein AF [Heliophilum fasciatum]TCP67207.1 stage V sporulation protein AF [Heliophilum fasciatum]